MARILALVLEGKKKKRGERGDVSSEAEGEIPVLVLRAREELSDRQILALAEGKRRGGISTLRNRRDTCRNKKRSTSKRLPVVLHEK